MKLKGYNEESIESFQEEREQSEKEGFELIKKFVEMYPNTEYPSVDDKLIETFCRGARKMGIYHLVLPEDDTFCPHCKVSTGKLESCLSLHVMEGSGKDSTLCYYCSYEECIQKLPAEDKYGDEDCAWNTRKEHDTYCNKILEMEGWK